MLKAMRQVFVKSLIDNNERVASFKYTLPNARLECNKHKFSDQNGENQHGLLQRMVISQDLQNSNKLGRYCPLPPREATSDA